jgi:polar amino acid transport system permease protein
VKLRRRQRERLSLWLQYLAFVAIIAVVIFAADWGRLSEAFFRVDIIESMFPTIITVALRNTILYTLGAFAFGLIFGTVLALMRLSRVAPYRWVATAYIELFRGLPALLVLFLVGYGIPIAFPEREIPGGVFGSITIGLGLTAAAYMAETIRAGIQAVPKGQMEAARTLGMSHFTAMRTIVIPQAFRIVIPPLTNELVLLFKDSSMVLFLGVTLEERELAKFGRDLASQSANSTPILVAGLCYLLVTVPLGFVVRRLEAKAQEATK